MLVFCAVPLTEFHFRRLTSRSKANMEVAVDQMILQTLFTILFISFHVGVGAETVEEPESTTFKIDGKVFVTSADDKSWVSNTRVLLDGGKYRGFLR